MNDRNERSETALGMRYKDVSESLMPPKQARYDARIAVLVVFLVSAIAVLGGGTSFFMETIGLNFKMNTNLREGTVPEHDFDEAQMLYEKHIRQHTRPSAASKSAPNVIPVPSTSSRRLQDATGDCQIQQYTLTDIAQNADCWANLYGVVYDITDFLGRHPGGSIIRSLCGTDGTTRFDNAHSVGLLRKKGFSSSIIGRLGESSGVMSVPCNEVDSVAVTGSGGSSRSPQLPLSTIISIISVSMIIVGW